MADIVDMDSRRPHIAIYFTDGGSQVLPVALLQRVATGDLPPGDLGDEVLRRIVDEWLADRGC